MPREDLPSCDCRWLERAAHDPDNPIEFDAELEYNLKTQRRHSWRIYHCPCCAGRAPESLRGQMFAEVSSEESARLHKLIKDLKTERDVIAALGAPTRVLDRERLGPNQRKMASRARFTLLKPCGMKLCRIQLSSMLISIDVGMLLFRFSENTLGSRRRPNHAMEPTPPDLIMSLFTVQPFTCIPPRFPRRGSARSH